MIGRCMGDCAKGAVAQAERYSQQAMVNSLQSAVDGY